MYDNMQWDDVFRVWFAPHEPVTRDLTEEEIEEIMDTADKGYDRWLAEFAGTL